MTRQTQWQTIENVPQNQRVLVCRPKTQPMIAVWTADRSWIKDGGKTFPLHDHQPTHWMPLPEPPALELRGPT